LFAAVLFAALAGCGGGNAPGRSRETGTHVVISAPAPGHIRWNNDPSAALSPDGSRVAFLVFQDDGSRQLHLWNLAAAASRPVAGTEGGDTPFFSPDGQWLGFFADGSLKKVPLSGGEAVTLTPKATNLRGASWGPNNLIVFNLTDSEVLYEVSADGGEPRQLTTLAEGEMTHRWPAFMPDGSAVIFTVGFGGNPDDWQIEALRLDGGQRKVLVRGGTFGRYVTSGHLVYHRGRAIMVAAFDPAALEVRGTPVVAFESILGSPPDTLTGVAQFSFSSSGALSFVPPEEQTGGMIQIHVARDAFSHLRQLTAN
jgi:serine/threonine-protein kinase